jgi:acylphosphatase
VRQKDVGKENRNWAGNLKRRRLHIYYSGKVQGVGFRYTTKNVALGFDVSGIVRNLSDGRVELIAEGEQEELEAFQKGVQESGLGHFISKEDVKWEEPANAFRGFDISG